MKRPFGGDPLSNEAVFGRLYMCSKCNGNAEIEVVFTPRALAAFNVYKNFYSELKIVEEGEKAKIEGPCEKIGELLAEIIFDYKYYGL